VCMCAKVVLSAKLIFVQWWWLLMKWFFNLLVLISVIVLVLWLSSLSSWLGWVGFGLLLFGFPLYRLIKDRSQFVHAMKTVEISIWGKPLDKTWWAKNEMKHTKVKINWKKKKNKVVIDGESVE